MKTSGRKIRGKTPLIATLTNTQHEAAEMSSQASVCGNKMHFVKSDFKLIGSSLLSFINTQLVTDHRDYIQTPLRNTVEPR